MNKHPKRHEEMVELFKSLYDNVVADKYKKRGLYPSASNTISPYDFTPLIKWAKDNGYDSLKFMDESYDRSLTDMTYIIFDGNKPKICGVYDVEDAIESNFSKDFKKIK